MEHQCTKTACTKWNIYTCTHKIHDWEAAFWLQLCYSFFSLSKDGRNRRFDAKTFLSLTRCEHQKGYILLTLWRSESRTQNSWQNIFDSLPLFIIYFIWIFSPRLILLPPAPCEGNLNNKLPLRYQCHLNQSSRAANDMWQLAAYCMRHVSNFSRFLFEEAYCTSPWFWILQPYFVKFKITSTAHKFWPVTWP